jgi:hypothetical protein
LQCRLNADFDVVEIDEHRDLQFVFHSSSLAMRSTSGIPPRPLQGLGRQEARPVTSVSELYSRSMVTRS